MMMTPSNLRIRAPFPFSSLAYSPRVSTIPVLASSFHQKMPPKMPPLSASASAGKVTRLDRKGNIIHLVLLIIYYSYDVDRFVEGCYVGLCVEQHTLCESDIERCKQ